LELTGDLWKRLRRNGDTSPAAQLKALACDIPNVSEKAASKDQSITDAVARLRDRFGATAFTLADHWPGDACAIGVAPPREPGRLVYIATMGRAPGRYDVFLEMPPLPGSDSPYEPAGDFHDIEFEQLASVVAHHLGLPSSRRAG
jgi:hypothetical protein